MLLTDYKVNNYEIARTLEDINGKNIDTAKLGIPKLMTNMVIAPTESVERIDQDLFINSPDCKVSVAKTIKLQHYFTVSKYGNETLSFPNKTSTDINGKEYLPKGVKLMIEVLYDDVMNMHITGKE